MFDVIYWHMSNTNRNASVHYFSKLMFPFLQYKYSGVVSWWSSATSDAEKMLSRPDQFLNEDADAPIKLRLFDEDPPDTILVSSASKLPPQRMIEREFRKHGEIKSISKQDGGYVITFACAEGWCIQVLSYLPEWQFHECFTIYSAMMMF